MSTALYTIRRVRIGSTTRNGLILSAFVSLLPNLLVSWTFVQVVHSIRASMDGWVSIHLLNIPILNQPLDLNFVELLKLTGGLSTLRSLDATPVLTGCLVLLALTLLAGGVGALAGSLGGLIYNALSRLGGGIRVELEEVPPAVDSPSPTVVR